MRPLLSKLHQCGDAEALMEALALFQAPLALGQHSAPKNQCLAITLSEPSRKKLPWPFPQDCTKVGQSGNPRVFKVQQYCSHL